MTTKLTWLGHAAWLVEHSGARILIDPFLSGNPTASMSADQARADFILLTHAHGDHLGDTVAIAKRTGAPVLSNFEVSVWLGNHGVENAQGLNPGGGAQLPFGRVTFTRADHSSSFPDGTYGGVACGIVLQLDGLTLYNTGDTALFSDMELFGRRYRPDVVTLPIGDYFTMGPDDAVEALRLLKPRHALPQHYNTFPPIKQDGGAWASRVQRELGIAARALQPGDVYSL
ncbi:MAG: metal-dependent hydrolase [Anaerolineae bacterium]|nr:metal-dependent hydrolase [Anaerolineae bacterium]